MRAPLRVSSVSIKNPFLSKTDRECIGKTFEEFVDYEKNHKSELASLAYELLTEEDDEERDTLELKIRYYYSCFEDLSTERPNIIKLWDDWLSVGNHYGINKSKDQLLSLALLTLNSESTLDEREKLDQKLLDFILGKFRNQLRGGSSFTDTFSNIVDWFDFRLNQYLVCLKIGVTFQELSFLRMLYVRHRKELSYSKAELPNCFLGFSFQYHMYYSSFDSSNMKYEYHETYRQILLDRVILCRNIGYLEELSKSIYLYYKVTMEKRRALSWFLDYFVGYGEKPLRLLRLFIVYHLFFLCLLLIPVFQFKTLGSDLSWERVISLIYFNNTTMLTIGYGDIYPIDILTKTVVLIQQIVGFAIAGSFITLVLRKWFRF